MPIKQESSVLMRLLGNCALALIAWLLTSGATGQLTERSDRLTIASMVQLLAHPENYAGKRVLVSGYLSFGSAGLFLYLTKDHDEIFDYASSLNVLDDTDGATLSQSDCLGHYVTLEGTVRTSEGISWVIADVERVIDLQNRIKCWTREPEVESDYSDKD